MCLYHYVYFSSCQHGELSRITYCDRAKVLGLAERDSHAQPSIRAGIDYEEQPYNSPSTFHPPASSSASNRRAVNTHNQRQQYHSMAAVSPPKAHTALGHDSTSINREYTSPQRATLIPRSALPDNDLPGRLFEESHTSSSSAAQEIWALNRRDARDGAFILATEGHLRGSHGGASSLTKLSTACTFDYNTDTVKGSSEASIDINAERGATGLDNVRSASPRKPIPVQWLPPSGSTSTSTEAHHPLSHDTSKHLSNSSPVERKTVRATRSSLDMDRSHADSELFLTKEALDTVNANIASPPLRRSPSKVQRSPTKAPWNSPRVSPKIAALRQNALSPTKSSPPRMTHLGSNVTADHRRAPSSIVSSSSFHTARESPVRSPAISQISSSSAEDPTDNLRSHYFDAVANIGPEQIDDDSSRPKLSTSRAATSLRTRASRPHLSISIPPPSSALDAERESASNVASATSSSGASISPTQSSRIPRMSMGKSSSAQAPTLSSTLKQTKSTHTLRSTKYPRRAGKPDNAMVPKATGANSTRHVRTVDSTGSTPILSNRQDRKFNIPASAADAATTTTNRTSLGDVELCASYLQDKMLDTDLEINEPGLDSVSSTTSRVTSTSTVKPCLTASNPESVNSVMDYSLRQPNETGNVHSSDADDGCDNSTASPPGQREDLQYKSLNRGRGEQYSANKCRPTANEVLMRSGLVSDLRATATEFVPGRQDPSATDLMSTQVPDKIPAMPDMFALDGYGIPWFYHMYPVPILCPSSPVKSRSQSPKKLRTRKQRQNLTSYSRQIQNGELPPSEPINVLGATDDGPLSAAFSTQLDMIAHQAALQPSTNTMPLPPIDLTTVRNVATQKSLSRGDVQGYSTISHRRQNHRQAGNGLYGGRGQVGVPLYATVPFPDPVAPMGRPDERHNKSPKAYVGYAIGSKACGTTEIERAAEHGGGQACNTCEPDH